MSDPKDIIIAVLSAAGWDKTDKAKVVDVAEMKYNKNQMALEVEHDPSDESIILRIFGPNGELFLVAYYENKLKELLEAIISIQDSITEENYQECISRLLFVCPFYVDTGEDLVPLVADDTATEAIQEMM